MSEQRFDTKTLDSKNVGDIRDGVVETITKETDNSKRKTVYAVTKIKNGIAQSRKEFASETEARDYYNS